LTPPPLNNAPSKICLSLLGGAHKKADDGKCRNTGPELLDRFDEHISAQLLLLKYEKYRSSWLGSSDFEEGPLGFAGLHGIEHLGIVEAAAAALKMEDWDVHASDRTGSTALRWAAYKGREELVGMLLEHTDINPDQADKYGKTPLSWAASGGRGGIVKMILERKDVNPDRVDTKYGQTPLSLAAIHGQEGIVKILLERKDVNPDRGDTEYGRTPLSWAAEGGHEGIVKMVLERKDVNPNQPDIEWGQTPLLLAALCGHEGVVGMLLERKDVNPDQPDTVIGKTPFLWAASGGHGGVVKMLFERKDVNPDQRDTGYGRTPLSWAAKAGNKEVVKIPLERKEANPDRTDTEYALTPLSRPVHNVYEAAVSAIPERNDVRITTPDNQNQAPPSASPKARDGTVDILLQPANINLYAVGCGSQAPPPPPHPRDGCLIETQFSSHDPNADITDFNSQPSLPSADSFSKSPDDDLPTTEPSVPPPTASLLLLKFPYPLWNSPQHPNNTPSTLSILLNRYWVIRSSLFLVALLAYINRISRKDIAVTFARKLRKFVVYSFLKLRLRSWRRQDLSVDSDVDRL